MSPRHNFLATKFPVTRYNTSHALLRMWQNEACALMKWGALKWCYRAAHTVFTMNRLVLSLQQSTTSRALILTVLSRTSASAAARAVPKSDHHDSSDSVKPFSAIPGPKPSPVVRNLLEFRRNSKRINKFLEECYRKYGEVFKLETPGKINFNLKSLQQ